jgi:hypothetical protein
MHLIWGIRKLTDGIRQSGAERGRLQKKPPKSAMASEEYGSDQGIEIARRCT